jgi:hypothetical protein
MKELSTLESILAQCAAIEARIDRLDRAIVSDEAGFEDIVTDKVSIEELKKRAMESHQAKAKG